MYIECLQRTGSEEGFMVGLETLRVLSVLDYMLYEGKERIVNVARFK